MNIDMDYYYFRDFLTDSPMSVNYYDISEASQREEDRIFLESINEALSMINGS